MFRRASMPAPGTPPEERVDRLEMVVADLKDELNSSVLAKQYANLNLKEQVGKCETIEQELAAAQLEIAQLKDKLVASQKKNEANSHTQYVQSSGEEKGIKIALKNQDVQWVSTAEAELIISDLYARVIEDEVSRVTPEHHEDGLTNQLTEQKAEFENQLNEQKAQYETQLTEQKAESENQLTEQKAEYENQLTEQKAEYENQLTEQKADYVNQLTELKDDYEIELADQKDDLEHQMAQQRDDFENRLVEQQTANVCPPAMAALQAQLLEKEAEVHNLIMATKRLEKELALAIPDDETELVNLRRTVEDNEAQILELIEQVASLKAQQAVEPKRKQTIDTFVTSPINTFVMSPRVDTTVSVELETARLETIAVQKRLARLRQEFTDKIANASQATLSAHRDAQSWRDKYETDMRLVSVRLKEIGLPPNRTLTVG